MAFEPFRSRPEDFLKCVTKAFDTKNQRSIYNAVWMMSNLITDIDIYNCRAFTELAMIDRVFDELLVHNPKAS
jgi:hypothetical protein